MGLKKETPAKKSKAIPAGAYKATTKEEHAHDCKVSLEMAMFAGSGLAPAEQQQVANPKDLIGSMKLPLSLVPSISIQEQALAFLEGKLKYGEVNWRAAPVRASIYLDAAARHHEKYVEGDDRDAISRVHHLANAMACYGIILDAQHYGTLIDDRKMSNGNVNIFMDAQVDRVKHLYEIFAGKNPYHFKIGFDAPIAADGFKGSKGRNQD